MSDDLTIAYMLGAEQARDMMRTQSAEIERLHKELALAKAAVQELRLELIAAHGQRQEAALRGEGGE